FATARAVTCVRACARGRRRRLHTSTAERQGRARVTRTAARTVVGVGSTAAGRRLRARRTRRATRRCAHEARVRRLGIALFLAPSVDVWKTAPSQALFIAARPELDVFSQWVFHASLGVGYRF